MSKRARASRRPVTLSRMPDHSGSPVLSLGVVGIGSWGQHVLAAFASTPRCRIAYVCDRDASTLALRAAAHPAARAVASFDAVLSDAGVDAVAIATDAPEHASLARDALSAGKHVFVEKPLALSTSEARAVVGLAERRRLKLMVGHVLEYHPALRVIEGMLERGDLGRIYYAYSQRINLGVVRQQENAWWSLAPHDVAMICRLFVAEPVAVAAQGQAMLQKGIEDVVFATLTFADGRLAHVHVSWLDPHKIRKLTLVGSSKMVTFDDMSVNEKVRVYDKGAECRQPMAAFPDAVTVRSGDIVIPKIPGDEPLRLECRHFVDAVLDGGPIRSDGAAGVRVVRVLEAGQRSLSSGGRLVRLSDVG